MDKMTDISLKGELGRMLLEDSNFKKFIKGYDKEIADLYAKLLSVETIDPVIAKIQGKLTQLLDLVNRPRAWMREAAEVKRELGVQTDNVRSEDYDNG